METDINKNYGGRFPDADHFETLVAEYYPKILYHSLKKVRDVHSAEEITQETFLKAFINFRKLKTGALSGHGSFRSAETRLVKITETPLKIQK